jgi:ATP-dependent helicase HrpA
MARLPVDVALARMLIEAQQLGVMPGIDLTSFLSIQDPRERPADARASADAAPVSPIRSRTSLPR